MSPLINASQLFCLPASRRKVCSLSQPSSDTLIPVACRLPINDKPRLKLQRLIGEPLSQTPPCLPVWATNPWTEIFSVVVNE